ncbi:MAG: mannose-6-phosphate isomerase, class I [Labilithrix sp.]|nr:mannose-6-phosphate isomerase, class I [Labilithrix sp.]
MVERLSCTVMPYAWGSRTAIAELTGRPAPTAGPEAELWMGAHPVAPSRLRRGDREESLAEIVARDPDRELGAEVRAAFGDRLPFLLKVLAAEEPLSIQAHPTTDQARAGFDDEERRGVPRDAATRNYRDASHKPELLCALTPFYALCGFRRAADTLRLFDALDVEEIAPYIAPLRSAPDPSGLGAAFRALMTMPDAARAHVVSTVVAACEKHAGVFVNECGWAVRLSQLYPGDVGVVSALLLNLVRLAPGEAIYLGAGNLHAYLGGVGVEIMASSDNVLRGGLTKKHVDVPELMKVLDFADGPIEILRARPLDAHESVYDTPAAEFRLSRITLSSDDGRVERVVRGPEVVLCTDGPVTLRGNAGGAPGLPLGRGSSAFIPACTGGYTVERPIPGTGNLYRATVNLT